MPTTTTTTTSTATAGTTTTTVTESRGLSRGVARCSIVVNAAKEKVEAMIQFDTITCVSTPGAPLAPVIEIKADGSGVGAVRTITGVPGGPMDGKILTETCLDTQDGHSYAHNYPAPFGTAGYPFEFELENLEGTFAVDAVGPSQCILSWNAHYQTSDLAAAKAGLEDGFINPTFAFVKAHLEGGGTEEGVPPSVPVKVDVKGKVALVTGSSRGIGAATALHLGANGVKVVLASRGLEALQGVKAQIEAAGGTATVVQCDVTEPSQVEAAFAHATKEFGGVDFVYANAGYEGNTAVDIAELDDAEMFKIININVMGYLYTLKHAVKAFRARGGGAIAFTSSVGAIVPRHMATGDTGMIKKIIPYCVSKAANDFMARIVSSYTESDNIRSYGILPAAFETVMLQAIGKDQGAPTSAFCGFNPFNGDEVGDPKNIGPVVLAMFDNTTTYETGETVVCDGNKTAKAEVFYAQLNSVQPGGVSGYQFQEGPEVIRDAKGVPLASQARVDPSA